jgi:hypothetical protein
VNEGRQHKRGGARADDIDQAAVRVVRSVCRDQIKVRIIGLVTIERWQHCLLIMSRTQSVEW